MLNKNSQAVTAVIIFLVFLTSIIFFFNLKVSIEFFFLFLLSCIVFVLAFSNTNFALVILIFSMLLSPELKAGGGLSGRSVVLRVDDIFIFVIFFGWLAKMAVNKELGLIRTSPLNKPIIVYITICCLATFYGFFQGFLNLKQSFFYLLKYIEYFVLFFLAINNLHTTKDAKFFIFLMLITAAIVALYGWLQIPSGVRISAPFEGKEGEPNTLAGYLLIIMGIVIGLILYMPKLRFLLLGFLAFLFVPFLYTLSRGAWLAFFPMFLTFIAFSRKFRLPLIMIFIFGMLILPYAVPQRIHERVKETFVPERSYGIMGKRYTFDESTAARIESWQTAFQRFTKQPILGYGIPISAVIDNQYTRVLTETGMLGLMSFVWLLMTVFRTAWQTYNNTQNDSFAQGISLGFIAGFSGILAHALSAAVFIIVRIMEPFWFLAAIIAVLPQLKAPENRDTV